MKGMLLLASAAIFAATANAPVTATVTRGLMRATSANVSVYATGFNNPRGLTFGPDGMLYVAEGGPGGSGSTTASQCEQVPTLYAITAGSGCSHGVANSTNGIFRVNRGGGVTLVADLSAYQKAHRVAHPDAEDYEPDGTWYSMVAADNALYAVEPNHGEVDRIGANGSITRIADISATQGHVVPTAIAARGAAFYVGNLNGFPITPGSSKILLVTRGGGVVPVATGLTTVVGVAFDQRGRMYVLENSVNAGLPTPGNGQVVRVLPGGRQQLIASGLALPTGMTFGPDGALYVSNWGFGPPPSLPNGPGQVLRITIPD